MLRPNSSQIEAAKAVVGKYGVNYRNVGTDLHQNTAVMAIYAIFLGKLDSVPAEYQSCIGDVQISAETEDSQTFTVNEDIERGYRLSKGVEAGPPEGLDYESMVRVSEEAAELLGVEAGAYLHMSTVDNLVEEAQSLGNTNPDHNEDPADEESSEPDGDGKAKVDFESMTVDALKAFAAEHDIDLRDISKKADIIAAIREFGY